MKHALALYFLSLRLQIKSYNMYRFNFWLGIIGILSLYSTQLFVIITILQRFEHINGWNIFEVGLLFGFWLLTYGVMIFFFAGVRDFTYLVQSGNFDVLLLRPHNLLLQVMSGRAELNAWAHTLFGLAAVLFCLFNLNFEWSVYNLFKLVQIILGGALVQGGLLLLWAAISFWMLNTTALVDLGWSINANYLTYPLSAYNSIVKNVFTFFPLGFITYYPVSWLLEKNGAYDSWSFLGPYTFLVGITFLLVTYSFWIFASKYYKSTGN